MFDINSFILGLQKGKSMGGGESADAVLDEVDAHLDAINGGSVYIVTFVGEDGKTLCTVPVQGNSDCDDPIATNLISRPSKPSTLTFVYKFMGWSLTKDGAVNDDALKNITSNRTLYVVFSSIRIRGSCGESAYWTISDDYTTLNIYGSGVLQKTDEWWYNSKHHTTITNVTFNNEDGNITGIGEQLFIGCSFESVEIPDTVTEIQRGAFYICRSLKTVTIPSSVTLIGRDAFGGCSDLTSAVFEETSNWKGYKELGGTTDTVYISSSVLKDASSAAEALIETYDNYEWTRS
jgi:hypothetical protein